MNHKAKTTGAVAGCVVAMSAGLVVTAALVTGLAANTPDTMSVEGQKSTSVHQYTGPRTADAAEAWLGPATTYAGPLTPDAAEHWLDSGPSAKYTGPTTPDGADGWFGAATEGQSHRHRHLTGNHC